MPIFFVDGVGVQINDPDYDIPFGILEILDENNRS